MSTRVATSARPIGANKSIGNPALRAQLLEKIKSRSMFSVSRDMQIGPGALSRYITGLPMNTVTIRGIEATLKLLP